MREVTIPGRCLVNSCTLYLSKKYDNYYVTLMIQLHIHGRLIAAYSKLGSPHPQAFFHYKNKGTYLRFKKA